jgi:hypothetical protein
MLSALMAHTRDLVCEYERSHSADSARKLAKWAGHAGRNWVSCSAV